MRSNEIGPRHQGWTQVGRAAERFAHGVAVDARFFADRLEEHVYNLARSVRHEWQEGRLPGPASGDDARRIFDDVRAMVRDVADGVDELLEELLQRDGELGTEDADGRGEKRWL